MWQNVSKKDCARERQSYGHTEGDTFFLGFGGFMEFYGVDQVHRVLFLLMDGYRV